MSSQSSSLIASPTSDAEKSRNDRAMKKKGQKKIRPTFSRVVYSDFVAHLYGYDAPRVANEGLGSGFACQPSKSRLEVATKLFLTISRDPDAFVTFLIGPDEKKFIVHKEFACHYSPVLNAAFNSQFIEGQTQTYRLEDTTEGTFRLFLQWLYYQQLELLQLQDGNVDDNLVIDEDESLFGLWILADKLGAPHLQNLAIESIEKIRYKTEGLALSHLHYIYDNTSTGSLLREYMVDQCRENLWPESYINCGHDFPHEFLIELVASYPMQAGGDDLKIEDYFVEVGDAQ
jgi:hypothetical protein